MRVRKPESSPRPATLLALALSLAASACAAQGPKSANAPAQQARPAEPPPETPKGPSGDPFEVRGPLREEPPSRFRMPVIAPVTEPLPPPPAGLPPAPALCGAFVRRAPAKAFVCKDKQAALAALDEAMAEPDAGKRDALLVAAEGCAGLPPGLVRALRADLAPAECGDALVEPFLKSLPKETSGAVQHALHGLAFGGRLARTGRTPPSLGKPYTKARVLEFVRGPMIAWTAEQAKAIEEISKAAASLAFYGKGVAATEAGLADMRLVEAVRAVPLPEEYRNDAELKSAYFGSLEQSLDPRKARGRDAALVGLRALAEVGVLESPRLARARELLSGLYGGRRVDALDALVLPPLPPLSPGAPEERLAARLPTFYAGLLFEPELAAEPRMLRPLVEQGLFVTHRMGSKAAGLPPEARRLFARARVELARRYWRAVDVDEATALGASFPEGQRGPEAELTFAVALALRGGPEDAAVLMHRAPADLSSMGRTDALDAIAKKGGPYAGIAALDAALVKQITAPQDAGPSYWKDVSARFSRAATLLSDPARRALAEERAKAAEATAAALGGGS